MTARFRRFHAERAVIDRAYSCRMNQQTSWPRLDQRRMHSGHTNVIPVRIVAGGEGNRSGNERQIARGLRLCALTATQRKLSG
jgi:hypothetical protein